VLAEPPRGAERVALGVPARDVLAQIDYFVGRMDEALATPEAYDLAAKTRVTKDAHTLSALALVLALSDEAFPRQATMPGVLAGARRLALAEGDYEKASTALKEIKRAQAGEDAAGDGAQWESVASLSVLMKQVPVIHSRLTRNVDRRRLARSAGQTAGESATLAAIAQASIVDTSYAKTPAQADEWRKHCVDMRDASGEVNAAIHAQDFDRVSAGMKRLLLSCEACHATFRRP
jgi:hypothetical protein